ncbi:MAG: methionine synthase [Promethearchaeota archaeon]
MIFDDHYILGACLEDCIHVAGILNYFQVAENLGYKTRFLGPATTTEKFVKEIMKSNAKIIAISYRLTPENGMKYLENFIKQVKKNNLNDRIYYLGALPELVKKARKLQFFDRYFIGGESIEEVLTSLNHDHQEKGNKTFPNDLLSRIKAKRPYPILRAHFGLPSIQDTIDGIKKIADAKCLDVISIAPDQAAQEAFQRPEILQKMPKGSGGVPIRNEDDLKRMYQVSRTGNFPLLRIYSGTQDLVKNAKTFQKTIKNAWAAIPIFWYSELDGRGPLKIKNAIKEHLNAIKWHAERNIPVEVNDPHQWGLRMAPDHLVVADAYISARVAKELGVKTYIQQLMFNTPAGNNFSMDLARVLAMIEIVQPLIDDSFTILKQTRAGLAYFSPNMDVAKGQLSASTLFQMSINPHIVHVVSYCEGDHAATPDEIIESCNIINRVIQDAIYGIPDMSKDPVIQARKNELLEEALTTLQALSVISDKLGVDDPYLSPETLTEAVKSGLLDAPQLKNNPAAKGTIKTRIINGACIQVDNVGTPIKEKERLISLGLNPREGSSIVLKKLVVANQGGEY